MLLVLSLIFVICFSVIFTSILGFHSRLSILLSSYVLGMANVIFVAELAGIFQKVDNEWFFVSMHMLLVVVSLLIWWLKGKPKLISLRDNFMNVNEWINSMGKDPLLWILAIGVILIFLINAVIIINFHANTNDSLAVHLARIGYWLQFGSFRPWPTENLYQITYPFNAQVQMLWTILLSGTDQLVEFVQWFSAVFGIIAIVGIASAIGYTKKQGLFAGLIWATLPMILLQSTTAQNDLITASVILIGIYFLFLGIKSQNAQHLIISGLAFGISLGIKQTAFFIIPGIGIAFIIFFIKYKKALMKSTLIFISSATVAFLLLGSFVYINNLFAVPDAVVSSLDSENKQLQTPFGPSDYVAANMGLNTVEQIKDSLLINTSRYFFQAADLTGLPIPYKNRLGNIRESVFRLVFTTLNIPVESDRAIGKHNFTLSYIPMIHEDEAWFGMLGFLLIFLSITEIAKSIKTKNIFPIALFFIALSAYLSIVFFRNNWTPYQARYMVTVFSCLAPFYGSIYYKSQKKASITKVVYIISISFLALLISMNVVLNNEGKPLRPPSESFEEERLKHNDLSARPPSVIFTGDRLEHYRISSGYLVIIVDMVDKHVPKDATLGLAIGRNWEYPFFGENITRKLVPIYPSSQLYDVAWLLKQEIHYILIDTTINDITNISSYFRTIDAYEDFRVLAFRRPTSPFHNPPLR